MPFVQFIGGTLSAVDNKQLSEFLRRVTEYIIKYGGPIPHPKGALFLIRKVPYILPASSEVK